MKIILATCGFILCYGNNRKARECVSLVFMYRKRGCSQAGGVKFGSTAPMCQIWEVLTGKVRDFSVLTPVQGGVEWILTGNIQLEKLNGPKLDVFIVAEFKSCFEGANRSQCWWVLLCLLIILLLYYYRCAFSYELHYFRCINYSLLSILLDVYSQTSVIEGIWHPFYRMWPFDP